MGSLLIGNSGGLFFRRSCSVDEVLFFDIVEIIGRDAQAALVCFATSVS